MNNNGIGRQQLLGAAADAVLERADALRVVVYLRQSDREQRLSIARQRDECRRYALARGWVIVREYVDDGKSGSKEIAKRTEWLRMIAEAEQPNRDWDAILCWDTARFGRLNAIEGAPFKARLMKAKVCLETVNGQRIDWNNSRDRIFDALDSEGNYEYSLKISNNAISGRRSIVDLGYWATVPPYGFDRRYVEGETVRVQRLSRAESLGGKPRNWRLVLIPSEKEAAVVRWLFGEWREKDLSFTQTVKMLLARGIPSPSGNPSWTLAQVKRLLTERAYLGESVIGNGEKGREVHNRIGARFKANAHEALVDAETFAIVGQKVREREGAEWRPRTASGPLSGVCRCGHCGYIMARRTDGNGRTKYVCETSLRRPHIGCHQWRIDEREVLPLVIKELVRAIDFEIIGNLVEPRDEGKAVAEIERLSNGVERLKKQLERAAKNLLIIDSENFAAAQEVMTTLRKEYERAANALKLAQTGATPEQRSGWVTWWRLNRDRYVTLAKEWGEPWTDKAYPKFADAKTQTRYCCRVRSEASVSNETFRDLLRRLNVEVRFLWRRKGRLWVLTTGILRARFDPNADRTETTIFRENQSNTSESARGKLSSNW